jgi:hypothetical protein
MVASTATVENAGRGPSGNDLVTLGSLPDPSTQMDKAS